MLSRGHEAEKETMRVEFIAYAGDCRVAGATTLADGERLTDVLNRDLTIVVEGARLTSHADGHTVEVGEITLERDGLFAIEALGPRGQSSRRIHTVRHRLEVRLGPHTVLGQLHTMPGGRPLVAIGQRSPMIPMTNATIAFNTDDGIEALDIQTLIINRSLAEWVRADAGDDLPTLVGMPVAPLHPAI
jgi:hypothetical protein